jgi:hypothetical protein
MTYLSLRWHVQQKGDAENITETLLQLLVVNMPKKGKSGGKFKSKGCIKT